MTGAEAVTGQCSEGPHPDQNRLGTDTLASLFLLTVAVLDASPIYTLAIAKWLIEDDAFLVRVARPSL